MGELHWSEALVSMRPCREGLAWARTQPDPQTAWDNCEDAAWMWWVLARLPGEDALLRSEAACFKVKSVDAWPSIIRELFPLAPSLPIKRDNE